MVERTQEVKTGKSRSQTRLEKVWKGWRGAQDRWMDCLVADWADMKKPKGIGAGGLPVLPLDLGKRVPCTLEEPILVLPIR